MSEMELTKPQGGTVTVRQDSAGEEVSNSFEVATAASAAAARAEHEGRILVAQRRPRDEDQAAQDIMRISRKPNFADLAMYQKPTGGKMIEGLSIRWVEMALQYWGNTYCVARIVYEDADRALLNVTVSDLQRNNAYSTDAMVDKLVERRELKSGRNSRRTRLNSYGDQVYLVEATHDEFRNLVAAERSKLIRDSGLRLLPRDLQDDARAAIQKTVADQNAKDPDSAKKKVLGQFASLGVSASMLKDYLEAPIETLGVKGLQDLAVLFNGLKDGEFSWADVMRMKREPAEAEDQPAPVDAGATARQKLRAQLLPDKPKPAEKPEEKK